MSTREPPAKRYRSWTVFLAAMVSLLVLIVVPSMTARRRSEEVYREIRAIQQNYERNQGLLDRLSRNMFLISIAIREFLLDDAPESNRDYLQQVAARRSDMLAQIADLRRAFHPRETVTIDRLRQELDGYWDSVLPVFEWTPEQKAQRATYFLRQEQRPRRQSILAIAEEIGKLNAALYHAQYEKMDASARRFRTDIDRMLRLAFLAGLLVSVASILRIAWLERRAFEHYQEARRNGEELRSLSVQLRRAQEEERKVISRELHDAVGQKMTALRMALGGFERLRHAPDGEFGERLAEIKGLTEQSLRLVRDLAAGLRPSVLDDLGLGPAIQQHARLFSRHTGIPVHVTVRDDAGPLSERQGIYLYRIVQEALTNSAKHARPRKITVVLENSPDRLRLLVSDDGDGFDPSRATPSGLGLVGIEERVRELGGSFTIESAAGQGTTLRIEMELKEQAP